MLVWLDDCNNIAGIELRIFVKVTGEAESDLPPLHRCGDASHSQLLLFSCCDIFVLSLHLLFGCLHSLIVSLHLLFGCFHSLVFIFQF